MFRLYNNIYVYRFGALGVNINHIRRITGLVTSSVGTAF